MSCGYGGGSCPPPTTAPTPVPTVPVTPHVGTPVTLAFTGGDVIATVIFAVIVLTIAAIALVAGGRRGSA